MWPCLVSGCRLRTRNRKRWPSGRNSLISSAIHTVVTGVVDASALTPAGLTDPEAVLNGIAHRPGDPADRLLVTGKRWPVLYEVRLVPE